MTDAPNPQQHDGSHDGPIRTPKQLIWAVLWAHILPIGAILLLVALRDRAQPAGRGQRRPRRRCDRQAHPAGRPRRSARCLRHRLAEERRAGLRSPVHRMPHRRRRWRPEARRPAGMGPAHRDRLRRAAAFGPRRQGRDGSAGRWRLHRPRDRARRGLHDQQGRCQVRRAEDRAGDDVDREGQRGWRRCGSRRRCGGEDRDGRREVDGGHRDCNRSARGCGHRRACPRCSRRPARSAMPRAWPVHPRSATRRRGRRASRKASTV